MDDLITLLKEKIETASMAISKTSNALNDATAALAIERLSRSISYLYQMKEREN